MHQSSSSSRSGGKERQTLVQQAGVVVIKDPEAHTRHQVSELDKQAKSSITKKKAKLDEIESDNKKIAHIDEQIAQIRTRYDRLCDNLNERLERKKLMIEKLGSSVLEERRIMGETKGTVGARKIDDFKLSRRMVTAELQSLRGYTLQPESTFYQSRSIDPLASLNISLASGEFKSKFSPSGSGTLPLIPSKRFQGSR